MNSVSARTRPRIVVLGAGGHGRVVLDILHQAARYEVCGFLDNNADMHGRRVDGVEVLGGVGELPDWAERLDLRGAIIAVGDNGLRRALARRIEAAGLEPVSAVHPSAAVARSAIIGRNAVIAAGVVLCAHCQVGDSVILNTGSIVDYQTMIGEGCHVCPGVRVAARVKIESGAFLGIGATVIPEVVIGYEAVVGAGSVVIDDVAPMSTVVGVPARPIRRAAAGEDAAAMLLPAVQESFAAERVPT